MGTINNQILNFADKLIPISDFSKGKTAQIFEHWHVEHYIG